MLETDRRPEFISPPQDPAEPPPQHLRHGRGVRTGAIVGLTLLLAVIFVIGGFAGWVFARAKSSATGTTTTTATQATTTLDAVRESVAAKVKPTIVEIYVTLAKGAALGSGVIVDSRGYIVTNNHVVSGALSIQVVLSNGTKEPAQLAGTDAAYDLAILCSDWRIARL
jgi:S1-C subfamily serine protease